MYIEAPGYTLGLRCELSCLLVLAHPEAFIEVQLEFTSLEFTLEPHPSQLALTIFHTKVVLRNFLLHFITVDHE